MTAELTLRYFHFISIFTIVSCLVAEHLLLEKEMTPLQFKKVSRVDAVYGFAAVTLLTAGLTLWLGSFGKAAEFYSKNWIFHLKLTLFIVIGILSIYPTVFFIKAAKKTEAKITVPKSVFWLIRIEIILVFIIPILAGLMAKGIGLNID